jgi:hypothetical protein
MYGTSRASRTWPSRQGGTAGNCPGEGNEKDTGDALTRSRSGRLLQPWARIAPWWSFIGAGDRGRAGDSEGAGRLKAGEAEGEGRDEGGYPVRAPWYT